MGLAVSVRGLLCRSRVAARSQTGSFLGEEQAGEEGIRLVRALYRRDRPFGYAASAA